MKYLLIIEIPDDEDFGADGDLDLEGIANTVQAGLREEAGFTAPVVYPGRFFGNNPAVLMLAESVLDREAATLATIQTAIDEREEMIFDAIVGPAIDQLEDLIRA